MWSKAAKDVEQGWTVEGSLAQGLMVKSSMALDLGTNLFCHLLTAKLEKRSAVSLEDQGEKMEQLMRDCVGHLGTHA